MSGADLVVASNRGPLSFTVDGDDLVARRGAGGLVSGIGPVVAGEGATWVAAAMSDGDRAAAASGAVAAEGFNTRFVDVPPDRYRGYYDHVCNAVLWFVHHDLFDRSRRPRFDAGFIEAWDAYRAVNATFADAIADEAGDGATVLVQDYHLALVGGFLRVRRPDLRTVHFTHTPFAGPDALAVLPRAVASELVGGLAGHGACGFHTRRWVDRFQQVCAALDVEAPPCFVAPIAPDLDDLTAVAASDAGRAATADLRAAVGDRALIVRVDRIELSKNLLRGFWAFDALLDEEPHRRGAVSFAAFVYPSRQGLPEYLALRQEVETTVARVNARWGSHDWTPILYDDSDDFPRSLAALGLYDVLLVNPIRDGLNLVAIEGPLLNRRSGSVLLSREAGAFEHVGHLTDPIDPFDVHGTARAMAVALDRPMDERERRADLLVRAATARTPADWLAEQLAARPL